MKLASLVDFEIFRPRLDTSKNRSSIEARDDIGPWAGFGPLDLAPEVAVPGDALAPFWMPHAAGWCSASQM